MKRKPIRVNWDELEAAFDNQSSDLVYYLDLVTGHVILDGEGEDPGDEDDPAWTGGESADDGTRAYVEPLATETKVEWIRRYVAESGDLDPGVRERLVEALRSDEPATGIIATFRDDPEAKDHWYRFRDDRLHERIEEWLRDHGVEWIDPPPWA